MIDLRVEDFGDCIPFFMQLLAFVIKDHHDLDHLDQEFMVSHLFSHTIYSFEIDDFIETDIPRLGVKHLTLFSVVKA